MLVAGDTQMGRIAAMREVTPSRTKVRYGFTNLCGFCSHVQLYNAEKSRGPCV